MLIMTGSKNPTTTIAIRSSTKRLLEQVKKAFVQEDTQYQDLDEDTIIAILASGFLDAEEEDLPTTP